MLKFTPLRVKQRFQKAVSEAKIIVNLNSDTTDKHYLADFKIA
ncbi:hypothetical protein CSUNSWCD_1966 [Campylobacter showae CSUNSWCD]|uniref:Uncharacterized protein n=1 Tax=Campylobacter showae CSUNSWCD TaxID=1244083 RepID=M5IK36_9BACT|nr:hypothetical protein CSUNSWCD_1966 [Campylobacter showae CSUNSWCD]